MQDKNRHHDRQGTAYVLAEFTRVPHLNDKETRTRGQPRLDYNTQSLHAGTQRHQTNKKTREGVNADDKH